MDPSSWMEGKLVNMVKIHEADYLNKNAGYASKSDEYYLDMNPEIEQTLRLQPFFSLGQMNGNSTTDKTSQSSKRSIFDDNYRGTPTLASSRHAGSLTLTSQAYTNYILFSEMNSLHHEFVDNVLAFNSPDKVFDMIESFIAICSEGCKMLNRSLSKVTLY